MALKEQVEKVVEGTYCRVVLGVRREFDELDPVSATLLIARSRFHVTRYGSRIEGYPLPKKGSAILAGNHQSEADSYKICIAGVDQASTQSF